MFEKTITRIAIAFGSIASLTLACSSSQLEEPGGRISAGTGGASGAQNQSGTSSGGASGSTATTGGSGGTTTVIVTPTGGSSGTGPVDPGDACGTGEASATLKKITMLIMFDRSWSMTQCADPAFTPPGNNQTSLACTNVPPGPSRWDLTSQALTLFFQDPQAADLNVALRFFPDDVAGCTGFPDNANLTPNCDVATCAQPLVSPGVLSADVAPTDSHEAALVGAVQASVPPGPAIPNPNPATPTSAALGGAAQWATMHQATHPDEQAVIVLITDGEPFGCDTDPDNIAQIAGDAYTQGGVLTYAVGLTGSSEAQLNQIAMAGGTNTAFFVADGGTATQDLLAALLAIRGMPIACDFPLPTATAGGQTIDPALINVNYTLAGLTETELGLVGGVAECADKQAWYYDDPANPMRIMLCPAACAAVTNDPSVQIKILAGCKPRPPL
jgi:hypothetical protein